MMGPQFKNYKCFLLAIVTLSAAYVYHGVSHYEYPNQHDSYERFELSVEILNSNNSSWELWLPTPFAKYENFSNGVRTDSFEIAPVIANLVDREDNLSIKRWNETTMLVFSGKGDIDLITFREVRNFTGYFGYTRILGDYNVSRTPDNTNPEFIFNSSNDSVARLVWTYSSNDCPRTNRPEHQFYFDEKDYNWIGESGSMFDLKPGISHISSKGIRVPGC